MKGVRENRCEIPSPRYDPLAQPRHLTLMNSDERERMYQLCAMIEKEKDHGKFLLLIEELNSLLKRRWEIKPRD
jgi:hypothetical protein